VSPPASARPAIGESSRSCRRVEPPMDHRESREQLEQFVVGDRAAESGIVGDWVAEHTRQALDQVAEALLLIALGVCGKAVVAKIGVLPCPSPSVVSTRAAPSPDCPVRARSLSKTLLVPSS
jgi:hypothetical protein